MSSSNDFPVLFTIGTSNRHDVISVNTSLRLKEINRKVEAIVASSPNCEERLSKYSKNKNKLQAKGLKVRWAGEPREAKLWPTSTIITDENVEAILSLMSLHAGKDVLEVEMFQEPLPKEEAKEGEGDKAEGEKKA